MAVLDIGWLTHLEEQIPVFLRSLRLGDRPGRYLPCARGATPLGREMGLGFSCFALRTLHMMDHVERLCIDEREAWFDFIKDYQRQDGTAGFEDPPQLAFLHAPGTFGEKLARWMGRGSRRPRANEILLAETKQAIATLADVGTQPTRIFRGFASDPGRVQQWMESLNWSRPWGAGGQAAGLVVFLVTQGPHFMAPDALEACLEVCRHFYADIADSRTGGYFRGSCPDHGELMNGAMKVLMALDWLKVPPHYPVQLTGTCIAKLPSSKGCHLVDAVYVLERCLDGDPAERAIAEYCGRVIDLIRTHAHTNGGFSFFVRRAQTQYYGCPISKGLDEPDVQGTCLLVWALALIWRILDPENARWKLIRA